MHIVVSMLLHIANVVRVLPQAFWRLLAQVALLWRETQVSTRASWVA